MDNLDITPAFIDIFNRINKHLDLLPFQKLLNDQNSTLTDDEKQELKTKIKESAKKVRQLNLVLDELKDQLVNEIEKVNKDFDEKNLELDALEDHLNYVKSNQFNKTKTSTAIVKPQDLDNDLTDFNDLYGNQLDEIDQMKKENMNRFINQQSSIKPITMNGNSNLPKKSIRKPTSHLKQPNSCLRTNDMNINDDQLMFNKPNQIYQSNHKKFQQQQQQQPKKEKIKNADMIYINYPQINYISLNEFNYIPQYMRGRLSFETCNKLVDDFNKALETKYKFMMIPNNKYSNDELTKYTLYKNQENDETRGLFFVTPKDLHEYSDLKISMNNTKIFIQCVRHCKRIKEIRGIDRLVRYVVLSC